MHVAVSAIPQAGAMSGFPLAVMIAVTVTALVAVGMIVVMLRRTMRPTGLTVGISVVSAIAVLVGALLVGGSLTQSPTSASNEDRAPRGAAVVDANLKLGEQLPTV